jgi:transcriptional regulator with XRE-family HTH domain
VTARRETWLASPLRLELTRLREKASLSINQAAERAGVTAGALAAYERGSRTPPSRVLPTVFAVYGYDLLPVPFGTPPELLQVAAETAETLRTLADRLERPTAVAA